MINAVSVVTVLSYQCRKWNTKPDIVMDVNVVT